MYNAENPKHEGDLEGWVNQFPKKMGISASMCIGFAHHLNGRPIKSKTKPRIITLSSYVYLYIKIAKGLANLQIFDTSVEEGASTIIPAFDNFFN